MKYVNAVVIALVVTAALFFTMRALIESGDASFEEKRERRQLDFVEVQRDESIQKKDRKPKKPPKPEDTPPPLEQPQMESADLDTSGSALTFAASLSVDTGLDGGLALDSGDGEYLPIVKVAPIYPRRALSRGIEGYVIVEFTVTKLGAVRNPVVVEAQPQGVFDQAAKDAAKKFKYKPRVIDGVATEVAGVQNKITFKMNR
ncbi:MAG: TonB family protein [Kangiellaceae bacterium]|nr:TonB family protein [Kangiellaceae bacterium]MCW9016986.1 TonB family protein [Kangiellaceae bacterium]